MAIAVMILLPGLHIAINSFNLIPEDSVMMVFYGDLLGITATLIFLIGSLLGLLKSMNLKIRDGMYLFFISSLSFFVAEIIWAAYYFLMNVEVPYPSAADVFYIFGSIALVGAILLVTRGLKVKPGVNIFVLLLVVVSAVAVVAIYTLLTDALSEGITTATILDLAYPVLDVICLVLIINLLTVSFGRGVLEAQIILTLGVVIMCISDIYFSISTALGTYSSGSLIDTLFAVSYILMAISVSRYVDLTRFDILMDRISKISGRKNA